MNEQRSNSIYIAISGVAGIGKSTSLSWLTKYLNPLGQVISLPDSIDPFDETSSNEELVLFLAHQKLKRDGLIREYLRNGMIVLCDRTYLDPLALAMTILAEEKWQAVRDWYGRISFLSGYHLILTAPSSVVASRRMKRGSSPRSTFLRSLDLSQEQYETKFNKNWRLVHATYRTPYQEVDFSSSNLEVNLGELAKAIEACLERAINAK